MNVLILNKRAPFEGLGAEQVIWEIGKRFAKEGHEVNFFCPHPQETEIPSVENIRFHFVETTGGITRSQIEFFIRGAVKYQKVYREVDPDLVYDNPSPFLFHLAHIYGSAPVVTKVHTIYRRKAFLAKDHWLVKLGTLLGDESYRLLRGELFTPVSDSTGGRLRNLVDTERNKVVTNANGTDLSSFEPGPENDPNRVLYLSKLGRKKGILTLLDAWKQVEQNNPEAELLVAGSGPLEEQVNSTIDDLNLSSVRTLGFVSEERKRDLFSESLVFTLPTHIEGMPLTIIEAMASGCAVVSTDTYGVRDVVEHEESGMLVSPGDSDELATALLELLNDPDRAASLAKHARRRALDFDIESMLDREMNIVQTWLNEEKGRVME